MMKVAVAACLAVSLAGSANAAVVTFSGRTNASAPSFGAYVLGAPVSISVSYTPNPVGNIAMVTSAVFAMSGQTIAGLNSPWTTLAVAPGSTITYNNNGAAPDSLDFFLRFAPNGAGLGTSFMQVTFSMTDDVDTFSGIANAPATQANIDAILLDSLGGKTSTTDGRWNYSGPGGRTGGFNATANVPEPGSIALLSGLGLVAARGAWRRRQKKSEQAA
jgi:hypothetical protein